MTTFFSGLWTIVVLELRQRVRNKAWFILLGVFVGLIAVVTVLLWFALNAYGDSAGASSGIYSTVIYFVLLLGTLVTPAFSGNAINGDRDAGTLATTQVTHITTWQLVLGKFLSAWVVALAFLAASIPFLLFAVAFGGVRADTVFVSLVVLCLELGVIAAIGVGLSGILSRPLFSIVVTYLVVAALSVGTLIAFGLAGLATQSEQTFTYTGFEYQKLDPATELPEEIVCLPPEVTVYPVPRYDYYWGILVANPYVLLADASPTRFDSNGYPQDLFGSITWTVRMFQLPPDLNTVYDDCAAAKAGYPNEYGQGDTAREVIESTVPGWFVGLLIHLVLAVGALVGAWAATRTPAGRLATGSRVA